MSPKDNTPRAKPAAQQNFPGAQTARLLATAAGVLALTTFSACSTLAPSTPTAATATARPIVLVHGAWMGASAWDRVASDLRQRGFRVTAVELPGHGADTTPAAQLSLDGYVKTVLAALPAQGQAIVVGHSMGGMVISALAEQAPERVAELVYVAGYLPQNGESLYKIAMTDADSRVGAYWTQADPKAYSPASLRPEGIAEVFCTDCNEADRRALVSSHRAEAVPPLGTPVSLSAERFGRVPRSYVHTRQDNAVSFKLQQNMLARAGGARQTWELNTSHLPMLTQPRALADILADVAR